MRERYVAENKINVRGKSTIGLFTIYNRQYEHRKIWNISDCREREYSTVNRSIWFQQDLAMMRKNQRFLKSKELEEEHGEQPLILLQVLEVLKIVQNTIMIGFK